MDFDENELTIIRKFLDDPKAPGAMTTLSPLYWKHIRKRLSTIINGKEDVNAFIEQERLFIDSGITEALSGDNYQALVDKVGSAPIEYPHLKIIPISTWLIESIRVVLKGDRKVLVEREIKSAEQEIQKLHAEVVASQETRKTILLQHLTADPALQSDHRIYTQVERLVETDHLHFTAMKTKKAIARGSFLSVDERRSHAQREVVLSKERAQNEALVNHIRALKDRNSLHSLGTTIEKLFAEIIDLEHENGKRRQMITAIEEKQSTISPAEMEDSISQEWDYLRDMVKLSAKRVQSENAPFLLNVCPLFVSADIRACFDRILEFDPRIFQNDHARSNGKPYILTSPGNGNAIYDWKNNRFIVPLVPPAGNFQASVATAIVEYRFDVDTDKKLLNSFWKIPEHKEIKTLFQIKTKFIKEYITWIVSDTKGYKVLSKDLRKWFEQEIAPSRTDIYVPPELINGAMSADEFNTLMKTTISTIERKKNECTVEELWTASILTYQSGQFAQAYDYMVALLIKDPAHIFGCYNFAFVSIKTGRKSEAIKAFGEFVKLNPQSWWASVANDYLRKLQVV
jgi:tetratricopeptide (TPR) repeat protein